jgi:hypothetical protein
MTTEAISILPLLIFYTLIGRGVLGATLFDKVCLRLAAGRCFHRILPFIPSIELTTKI